jgi:hypothetical protein
VLPIAAKFGVGVALKTLFGQSRKWVVSFLSVVGNMRRRHY